MKNVTRVLYVALAALALGACEKRLDTSKAERSVTLAASGTSGNLVGTPPAPPSASEGKEADTPVTLKETPETTSSSESSKELTKGEESKQMPLAGQPNDHSNVASDASENSGQRDPQASEERTGSSNPPQRNSQAATQ